MRRGPLRSGRQRDPPGNRLTECPCTMKALVLSSSPRRDGNSAILAGAVAAGLAEAGHSVDLVHATDCVSAFLRDCRQCRKEDGTCSIDDGFAEVFLERYLPADAFIAATPVYWYGPSAQLKAFFDRTRDWADLEEMQAAGTLDVEAVAGVLVHYLGPDDPRLARLLELG